MTFIFSDFFYVLTIYLRDVEGRKKFYADVFMLGKLHVAHYLGPKDY